MVKEVPTIFIISSHVAALGPCLSLQLVPQAHHLPRRLVMSREIILDAPELAEAQAVHVLHRFRAVEFLHPQSHTHIFHFE